MNKLLIIIGTLCTLLWGIITAITFGIPEQICQLIDNLTFHRMTKEVYRMTNGFYYDVSNNDMPTIMFLLLFGVIFTLVAYIAWQVGKTPSKPHTLKLIILFSILFRIVILPGELIHENDLYRYIWDAKATLNGINPFKYAPADLFMYENGYADDYYDEINQITIAAKKFSKEDQDNLNALIKIRDANPKFYDRIGHWQVPTIYPPVAQLLFVVPVWANGNSVLLLKTFFVLFDVASFFLIISLLNHFNKDPCMSILYGWSPLVLFEISNGGHYDSIPIFLTLLSLFLWVKRKRWEGTFVLALATLSKFFSAVLLPILIKPLRKFHVLFFGLIIFQFYVPYFLWDQTGVDGVFQGLATYNRQWSYNSSFFAFVYILLDSMSVGLTKSLLPAKLIVGCIYLAILSVLVLSKRKSDFEVFHKCFLAVAILFILNPVADPWYYCWVMPFLCFFPYKSWYLLSGLLMLGYLNFHTDYWIADAKFLRISLVSWITYVPFFLCLIAEYIRRPKFVTETLS